MRALCISLARTEQFYGGAEEYISREAGHAVISKLNRCKSATKKQNEIIIIINSKEISKI